MPRREFLGVRARELELTAELHAHETYLRYALVHEERRNFYTAYGVVSHEQHSRFCEILVRHFAKARRAETKSHSATNKLRTLRGHFLQQLALDKSMVFESSSNLRLHAPFIRSASPPRRGYVEEMGSISQSIGMSSQALAYRDNRDNESSRRQHQVMVPTQDQRERAAQYWYDRAIGLGVDEQLALHSKQVYSSGERDNEIADLLRQQAIEAEQDTADANQRREDQAYRVLAEDTLRQEAEQRKAAGRRGFRHLQQGQDTTTQNIDGNAASEANPMEEIPLIKDLMWEIEELKRKVALLSLRDHGPSSTEESLHSSDRSRAHSAYVPAEGEAGPSDWQSTQPEEYASGEWTVTGSASAGQTSLPYSRAGPDPEVHDS